MIRRTQTRDRARRRPLSYANVVSTLALVIAVGGGSALAAGTLNAGKKPAHHKPKLTLNSTDKAYISNAITNGHVAFATTANSATSATSATNATNATTATNATNATNAATATNALSLGGVAASGYTHADCTSQTGQIKGFASIAASGTFSSTFTTITAYSCSGQTVQAKRLGTGDYEVQFVGSPATIAIGNAENPGAPSFSYVSVTNLGPGDFEIKVINTVNGNTVDIPFAIVTP